MSDSTYSFNATVLGFVLPTASETPVFTESVPLTFSLEGTDDPYTPSSISVPLTGLTAPKMLVVKGGKGITVTVNDEEEAHAADPLFVMTNKTNGMTITTLTITNNDTAPHTVTVLAAE
jgi:hypothetical protein